jgi:cytochrome c biogenesis factor
MLLAPSPLHCTNFAKVSNVATQSWRETASSVVFALALTTVLAATLFVVVALNPKESIYGNSPWYYAGICVLIAPLLLLISRRLDGDISRTSVPRLVDR